MRALFAILIAASFITPTLANDIIPPQPVDGTIRWVYDYAEGKRLAKTSGKPLFIVIRCER